VHEAVAAQLGDKKEPAEALGVSICGKNEGVWEARPSPPTKKIPKSAAGMWPRTPIPAHQGGRGTDDN